MNKLNKIIVIVAFIVLVIMTVVYIGLNKTMESSTRKNQGIENKTNTNILLNIAQSTVNKTEVPNVLIANENITNSIADNQQNKKILPNYKALKYGTSENGRDLTYYSLEPDEYKDTLLLVFAIHGYEDAYDKDGQILVETAEYLLEYYKTNDSNLLNNNRLLIVKCANPDGLYDGKSCNGYGRCNAKGIDLNRDFDVIHKIFTSSRNYTPAPFSAKESKALADLIKKEKPVVVIDFHGWENCTIGDGKLAKIFRENMLLNHKTEFNNNCNGYLSYWAHKQGANALLVEFKNENISRSNLKETVDIILETF